MDAHINRASQCMLTVIDAARVDVALTPKECAK